jgi:putative ABC transport system permease protein
MTPADTPTKAARAAGNGRTLEVRRQVRLGFARIAEICLNGIYHRLFRSLVTLSIVTVAVAFMMYMLGGSLIGRAVLRHAQTEAAACTLYDRWLVWLDAPLDAAAMFRLAASAPAGDPRLAAIARWAGLDAAGMAALLDTAQQGRRLLALVDGLSPGRRLMLRGGAEERFLLDDLLDPATRRRFLVRLEDMGAGARLPGGANGLERLVAQYGGQRQTWQLIAAARAAAVRELHGRHPQAAGIADLLAAPPDGLAASLSDLGLLADAALLQTLSEEARYARGVARLSELLAHTAVRRDVAARARVSQLKVGLNDLATVYLSGGGPAFLDASLARSGLEALPPPDATRPLVEQWVRRSRVLNIVSEAAVYQGGWMGFSQTTLWLIGVSLIVCVVGIANAMLMSVMERFREIATMKCLGARDSFVMVLFVLESCVQGVAGGLLGAVFGLLLAVPAAGARFGLLVWNTLPWPAVGAAALLATAVGVLMAGLASLYPARVAARLVPMEAMRVE